MERSIFIRAAVGAILIGTGLTLMMSATKALNCVDASETPEESATKVAEASADLAVGDSDD